MVRIWSSNANGQARCRRVAVAVVLAALIAAACSSNPGGGTSPDESASSSNPATADGAETEDATPTTSAQTSSGSYASPQVDTTELTVDDDVEIGVLENGMTYYVRSNASPGSSVSMQLAVRAGGVNEEPIGTGLAHFLEHMMFNGTQDYPANTLDAALRSIGAEIGPDFNAFTSDKATVYQLTVSTEGDRVSTGMHILSQWARAATIEPAEVRAEAPIVREELRLRDETPDGKAFAFFEEAYYEETPFQGVQVSGTAETVLAIDADELRAFYDRWYTPDNMAVVVVGDMSTSRLKDLVEEHFSGLEPVKSPPAPDTDVVALRQEPFVETYVDPELANSYLSVDIPIMAWDANTRGGDELALIQTVAEVLIDNRINEGVSTGRLELRRGYGSWFRFNADLAYLGFNVDADNLVNATEILFTELEGSLQNPFTEGELDRAVDTIRSIEEQRLAAAGSTQDTAYAGQYAFHFLSGGDIRSVEDSVEAHLEILEELTASRVNDHWGWMMTSAAPIVIAVAPDQETVGTRQAHLEAIERASNATVDVADEDIVEIEELVASPAPIDEVSRSRLEKNDGFELEFANGIRVFFAPSDIAEGQVSMVTESPGGRAMLSPADGSIAPLAVNAVGASGVSGWSPVQVDRYLADQDVGLGPYLGDHAEGFSGGAASEDVETLFALLHASIIGAQVDDVPLAQQRQFALDSLDFAMLDGAVASDVALADARTGGGAFRSVPSAEAIEALTEADISRLWSDRFGALDDHLVVIVGDVDETRIIELSRRWIATLPPVASGIDRPQPFDVPASESVELSVGSGETGGSYRFLAVGEIDESLENLVLAEMASTLLNDRLFTVVREELGATYGGSASISFNDPGDGAELTVAVDGDPERIDEIGAAVRAELEAIRIDGPSIEDFSEARSVTLNEYGFISNQFIVLSLFDEAYGRGSDIRDRSTQFGIANDVTRRDVADFLGLLLDDEVFIEVKNSPS